MTETVMQTTGETPVARPPAPSETAPIDTFGDRWVAPGSWGRRLRHSKPQAEAQRAVSIAAQVGGRRPQAWVTGRHKMQR